MCCCLQAKQHNITSTPYYTYILLSAGLATERHLHTRLQVLTAVCSTKPKLLTSACACVLQAKQDNITSTPCQEELFYFELMEVTDFRNDVILAEACREDVDKYCKDVTPGALLQKSNMAGLNQLCVEG